MVVDASQASSLPTWVEWVSALAPFFTLLAAAVAGTIAVLSLRQRRVADAKSEWWTRFAWASDLLLDPRAERQEIGVRTLTLLARSGLAHAEELEIVDAAWGEVLVEPGVVPLGTAVPVSRVQVLAARGRQVTDARLGRPTEPWVAEIAGNIAVTRA
ncbi:hypothetical protein [Sanguibacter antarcticus]|uniref:Uncharacterized protein n=1 Tax=Sanguibacter antarcticus TaxID=372484 RepID=A0A2A9E9R0_9MICO|nr:hypothetical protein [Sanguibacter antarcticus]PFG34949.1 hypothetical protein ATL42_2881 [Sanguibacter antarcticus]